MPVKITYQLTDRKLTDATKIANEILASSELPLLITEGLIINGRAIVKPRKSPFAESDPNDLKPSVAADAFKTSNLQLTLCEYDEPDTDVGGMFDTGEKSHIYANRNAIPLRSAKNLARMLVHECVHALSREDAKNDFSHCGKSHSHKETAPYWVQYALEAAHSSSTGLESGEGVIEVTLFDGDAIAAAEQNRRCK